MDAKLNSKTHQVLIPKNGLAPMLFLEFLRDNSINGLVQSRLTLENVSNMQLENYFIITLHFTTLGYKQSLIEFINQNQ